MTACYALPRTTHLTSIPLDYSLLTRKHVQAGRITTIFHLVVPINNHWQAALMHTKRPIIRENWAFLMIQLLRVVPSVLHFSVKSMQSRTPRSVDKLEIWGCNIALADLACQRSVEFERNDDRNIVHAFHGEAAAWESCMRYVRIP